jgi:predicted ATPase
MINHLSIENFRSHKHAELSDCGRINILLGKNNAGKTAVLEAILMLCFPPNPREVLIVLNEQRGYKPGEENSELWDSYFYDWDSTQAIVLTANERSYASRLNVCQQLFVVAQTGFTGVYTSGSVVEGQNALAKTTGLNFKYQYEEGYIEKKVTSLKRKSSQSLDPKAKEIINRISPIAFIPSKGIANPQDEAERFSRLEKMNHHHEVEDALRIVEPRLKRLSVIASGKSSMVYGDLGDNHLIPVSLMGEGMVRMLSIASAMANNKGGIVLIDEIENGLHYSVLPFLWKMIFTTAKALGIQVFAATHSDECLHAASQVVQKNSFTTDLRLFRLDLHEGKTAVTDYSADELAVAIASDQEVR